MKECTNEPIIQSMNQSVVSESEAHSGTEKMASVDIYWMWCQTILRDYDHLTNTQSRQSTVISQKTVILRQQQTVTEDLAVLVDVQLLPVMEKPTELAAYWSHCSTQ